MKQLRAEAEDMEKELKQIDKTRKNMRKQLTQMREVVAAAKMPKNSVSIKDLQEVAERAKGWNEEAGRVMGVLERMSEELDRRHIDLDKYLAKA